MKGVDDIIDREDVPRAEPKGVAFTEEAKLAATAILANPPESKDYKKILVSLAPYADADDLPGTTLVIESWLSHGNVKLVELIKFARAERRDEEIMPVLNWLRDILNPKKGNPTHPYDMTALTEACGAWIRENKVS